MAGKGDHIVVYVNDHRLLLRAPATVRDVVWMYDRRFLTALDRDAAEVMDAEGWPLRLDAPAEEAERIFVCLLPWAVSTL